MTIQREVFMDNTFCEVYITKREARIDFERVLDIFSEDDVDLFAHFFFQKGEDMEWSSYRWLLKTLEKIGWNVEGCLEEQSIHTLGYAPAMEMGKLVSLAFAKACETYDHDRPVEFVLCVNHLSYTPAIRTLKERYDHITLTLVCDTATANTSLMGEFDTVIDLDDLDADLEGAKLPDVLRSR